MKVASPAALAGLLQSRLEGTGDPRRIITLSDLLRSILSYPVVRAALDLAGKAEYDLAMLGFLRRGDLVQVDPAVVAAVELEAETPEPSLEFASGLGDSLLRLRRVIEVQETSAAPEAELAISEPDVDAPEPDAAAPEPELAASEPELAAFEPELDAPEPDFDVPVPEADHPGVFWLAASEPKVDAEGASAEATPEPPSVSVVHPSDPDAVSPGVVSPDDVAPDEGVVPDLTPLPDPRVVTEPEPWVPDPATAPACWRCSAPLPDRPIVFFCTQCGVSQDNRRCNECGDRVEAEWHFCSRCGTGLRLS